MSTGRQRVTAQGLREINVNQKHELGQLSEDRNGSVFVYGKAGASNLGAGKLSVAEAIVADHTTMSAQAAAAIGANQIKVTLGATAATADQYTDGFAVISDGTGKGIMYQIASHGAAALSTTLTINLYDPLTVALVATTSKVSLIKNPAKDVIESTTLSKAVGVPNVAVTAAYFGWFQKTGVASVLSDGTPTKGYNVVQSNGTAGAVEVFTDSTAGATDLQEIVGVANETLVSAKYHAVSLCIR
jgi:hypothetical protein